ncbi:MAG TPA: hypothetical protein VF328_02055 [Mycobacterium sp.]
MREDRCDQKILKEAISCRLIPGSCVETTKYLPFSRKNFAGPGGVREPRLFYRKNFGKLRSEERLTKKSAGSGRRSGGAPGDRIGDLTEIRDGFFRQYVNGRIYFRSGLTACHVLGAIGDRYSLYGGPGGWLGWPTSDELPFDGGAVSRFQNGAIYWWPDTGPIPLGDVIVRYTGLACFGETMVTEALSSSDEPYVIFCTTPAVPVTPSTVRTAGMTTNTEVWTRAILDWTISSSTADFHTACRSRGAL